MGLELAFVGSNGKVVRILLVTVRSGGKILWFARGISHCIGDTGGDDGAVVSVFVVI